MILSEPKLFLLSRHDHGCNVWSVMYAPGSDDKILGRWPSKLLIGK